MRKLRASETARRHAEHETQSVYDREATLKERIAKQESQLRSTDEKVEALEEELSSLQGSLATTKAKAKVSGRVLRSGVRGQGSGA